MDNIIYIIIYNNNNNNNIIIIIIIIMWDSLHARLYSHYEAWSYKKKKH